jgi:hypothetical protein
MTELDRIPDWMQPDTTTRQLNLQTWAQEFQDVYRVAEALCKTSFVPKEMIGKQNEVTACIMKGRELGLDPFDALGSMYIVHGRVGFYAEFMRRRIIQAGHTFRIVESGEQRCIVEGIRAEGGDPHRATFTADQARRAGIDLGKYPAEKLIARATSRLCKQAFPDVLAGSLIIEDIVDGVTPTTPVADEPAPAAIPAPTQRTRKPKPAKAAATQPKPAPTPPPEPDTDITELLGDNDIVDLPPEQLNTTTITPHPTDDTTPQPDEPFTQPQSRKMHTLFRQLNLSDRDDRLTITAHILGYHLDTSAGLTKAEANRIIDTLETWLTDTEHLVADRINDILNTAALAAEAEQEQLNLEDDE